LAITAQAESWNCKNDLEIACTSGKCKAEIEGDFTPMSVHVDKSGSMSVCAYTGCWEGIGKVHKSENFVIITGHDLKFSTSQGSENIVIVVDLHDNIAIFKVGAFAHPLICETLKEGEQ
jgi:hypothetical protein